MSLRDRMVEILSESGVGFVEKRNTLRTACPICKREDKFSILKENGASRCYRASCDFGKRWFADWMVLTLGITIKEARAMLRAEGDDRYHATAEEKLTKFSSGFEEREDLTNDIEAISWPEFHMTDISSPDSAEGMVYLARRGVTPEMASKYEVYYSKFYRRVYFPITMGGYCYGYQGRAIDPVEEGLRMRNNDGFRRDVLVMFADNLEGSDFAIMAEGPFDALKFDAVGSNVCTMGKAVTDKQLDIIKSYGIRRLYLALDDDAAVEMNEIAAMQTFESYYKIDVPASCVARCAAMSKKADFGECTLEEAKLAFENAKPLGSTILFRPNNRFR